MSDSDLAMFVNLRVRNDREDPWIGDVGMQDRPSPWLLHSTQVYPSRDIRGSHETPGLAYHFNADPLVRQLLLAIGQFSMHAGVLPLETRLTSVEHEVDELRSCLFEFAAERKRATASLEEVVREVRTHTPTMVDAFEKSFGVAPATLTVIPESRRDRLVTVALDASTADGLAIARARRSGARLRFLEIVMDALPRNVLDAVDFEFAFPKP